MGSSDPHIPPFTYVPRLWSVGDRLRLALSFPDEPALRRALDLLGLEGVADTKCGSVWLKALNPPLRVLVFGPSVLLEIGAEDPYEHLGELDFQQARELAALVRTHDLDRFVSAHFDDEIADSDPQIGSQAHQVLVRRARLLFDRPGDWLLRVGAGDAATGFATDVVGGPRKRRSFASEAPRITAETVASNAPRTGMLGTATVTVGQTHPGTFGAVVSAFVAALPEEADVATVRRVRDVTAALGVRWPDDDETRAALHRLLATEHPEAAVSLEAELVAELLVARDALSRAALSSALAIVSATLHVMERGKLPCLFDARRALEEAKELDPLFDAMIAELDRSLAATNAAHRYLPLHFGVEPLPTYARLTVEEHAALVAAGLIRRV